MAGTPLFLDRAALARWAGPLIVALAYWGAATVSLALTTGADGIAVVWPSSGVLLAALLLAPGDAAARYVGAAALASLAANLGTGNAPLVALGFTAANMAESVLAAWLLRRSGRRRPSFVHAQGLGRFCLAAVSGAAASAALAAAFAPAATPGFALAWATTDLLGMLVIAPMILIAADLRRDLAWLADRRRVAGAAAVLGGVAAVAGGTFAQSAYPLLFLPLLAVLVAVLRLGAFGGAASIWIIATLGSVATATGHGPIQLVTGGPLAQVLFLQFYVLAAFASALPLAALLAARDRLTAQLLARNRLLTMAEGAARVGHWRLDAGAGTLFWSAEVFRIHARAPDDPPSLADAIAAYHPDDRPVVVAAVDDAVAHGGSYEFTARIVRPCGEVLHVFSRGEADQAPDGRVLGVFGILQDVSLQVATHEALEGARRAAEDAARHATAMAETDQLTGLANRRRALRALEEAIAAAARTGDALSVAMFDLDHFKRINDSLGHAIGDAVLRRVARDAGGAARAGDIVGRIGGEEFVLVLPRAGAEDAAAVAERVRLAIGAGGAEGDADEGPPVSASFGVATLAAGETSDMLLGRADRALYAAKQAGRDTLRHAA